MTIKNYSITGQEIKTVVNGTVPAGQHELDLLAKNLSSGVYLCKMQSGKFSDIKNMIEIFKTRLLASLSNFIDRNKASYSLLPCEKSLAMR